MGLPGQSVVRVISAPSHTVQYSNPPSQILQLLIVQPECVNILWFIDAPNVSNGRLFGSQMTSQSLEKCIMKDCIDVLGSILKIHENLFMPMYFELPKYVIYVRQYRRLKTICQGIDRVSTLLIFL